MTDLYLQDEGADVPAEEGTEEPTGGEEAEEEV